MMQTVSNIVLLAIALATYASAVRIGSFNLHQYGPTKSPNTRLTNVTAQIINDFDLAIIQEITDISGEAPKILLGALNTVSNRSSYIMYLSERVGRSPNKEQYIFFNREVTSGLQYVNAYLYDDVDDRFERPPYVGTFKVKNPIKSGVQFFTIMNVHLKPRDAYVELLSIRYVIKDFILKHPQYFNQSSTSFNDALAQNVINANATNKPSLRTKHPILIVGDFNADRPYISEERQQTLRTIDYVDFTWMINNEVKTNTIQTCTYDRIFINGDNFVNAIIRKSNTTVNFQERFRMTSNDASAVSDHFPIKFDIEW